MERAVIDYEHEKDFWIASITHRLMGASHPLSRIGDILLRAEYSGSLRSVFANIESMTLAMNSCISSCGPFATSLRPHAAYINEPRSSEFRSLTGCLAQAPHCRQRWIGRF